MLLQSISYSQFEDEPKKTWKFENLELGQINLLVAKNASGKTRILAIIYAPASMLSAALKPTFASGNYHAVFDDNGKSVHYSLIYRNSVVTYERLTIAGRTLLDRGQGGIGRIRAEKIDNGKDIDFQTPANELAAVARRDTIQHPYLEPLSEWANSLRFYPFGTPLGRMTMTLLIKEPPIPLNEKDADAVTPILRKGITEFPESFKAAVIHDMAEVGYALDDIDYSTPYNS